MTKHSDFMEIGAFLCWLMLVLALSSCSSTQKPLPVAVTLVPQSSNSSETPISSNFKKFHTKSNLLWVTEVADIASCVVRLPELLNELGSVKALTHTSMNPEQVKLAVANFKPSGVRTYKTKNPVSKVIATTYASDRENLYLNTRKNPRPIGQMVNTLLHEASHLNGFSHGDNNPRGKELSVPYFLGALGQKYAHLCIK